MSKPDRAKALIAVTFTLLACATKAAPNASAEESSKQCRALVAQLYQEAWPKGGTDDGGAQAKFESHYNTKLNKCLYLETVSEVIRSPALNRILPRETQRLADANEKKDYGKYDSWSDGPPVRCWLNQKKCSSKQEWERLIKPYMED
ncbi:conserved exported hypothetical protein [Burkholderiales bacterium]|jgi:hypothetical protein|nr:conserved exported hypothetical protein [Burkholderiales bacterium]